ncbi:GNAT family N-acetyltransferase [Atopobacter phocae]|uniref:GNAT family N-acetyltransferase n=1 Tax=Atopobacter phocae TaxID=136492 RepID=UPI0004B797EA|nr:GNAT family N-acetyltransferase [Atopobacter phocae]
MIKHEGQAFVYVNEEGQKLAELTYVSMGEQVINANHTFVDPSLRGQGIADQLFQALIEYARKEQVKIHPTCSYVVRKMSDEIYQDVKA